MMSHVLCIYLVVRLMHYPVVVLDGERPWLENLLEPRGFASPHHHSTMTTDPSTTPAPDEQPAKADATPVDDFELPTERQEGTNNCTDEGCPVCQ